jgi:hypothetical protein
MPQTLRALAALALGAMVVGASAQTPGTYSGVTAQGYPIQVTVVNGPRGPEVTTIQASYLLTCELSPTPVSLASVTSGFFPIDGNGAFDATYLWDRDWFQTRGQLGADGTLNGTTAWAMAAVTRSAAHLAEVCASADVVYSASAAAAAAARGGPARAPDLTVERHLDRDGRVVRESVRRGR